MRLEHPPCVDLPKNPWLLALVASIWIGGNLATVHWQLQQEPWFPGLVLAALASSFLILWWDYQLVLRRSAPYPRWIIAPQRALIALPVFVIGLQTWRGARGIAVLEILIAAAILLSGLKALVREP